MDDLTPSEIDELRTWLWLPVIAGFKLRSIANLELLDDLKRVGREWNDDLSEVFRAYKGGALLEEEMRAEMGRASGQGREATILALLAHGAVVPTDSAIEAHTNLGAALLKVTPGYYSLVLERPTKVQKTELAKLRRVKTATDIQPRPQRRRRRKPGAFLAKPSQVTPFDTGSVSETIFNQYALGMAVATSSGDTSLRDNLRARREVCELHVRGIRKDHADHHARARAFEREFAQTGYTDILVHHHVIEPPTTSDASPSRLTPRAIQSLCGRDHVQIT